MNLCDWAYNAFSDKSFPFDYDDMKYLAKSSFWEKAWILGQRNPRILVTGASGWLGHYLLHILSYPLSLGEILAVDIGYKPEYLEQKRYERIRYSALQRRIRDLEEAIVSFRPQVIFHCDYVWPLGQETKEEIYALNARQVESVCKAASKADVKRVVFFSDFSVYGKGIHPAQEDDMLYPVSEIGKSFQEAEEISAFYCQKRRMETFHLRLAPLYGAGIPCGVMLLGKLMDEGMIPGLLQNMPERISVLNARDLSLASFLFLLTPSLEQRVFNLASQSIGTKDILRTFAEILPCKKILGWETRLAHIMKIGYQEQIQIPESWLKGLAFFMEESNHFFNALRSEKKIPVLRKASIDYLFSMRELCVTRLETSLGWQSSPVLWKESIEYAQKEGWNIQERIKRKGMEESYAIFDSIREIVESYSKFSPEEEREFPFLPLPLSSVSIDTKSVWILLERIFHFSGVFLLQDKKRRMTGAEGNLFSHLGKSILELIRYEAQRANHLFPESRQEQSKWIIKKIGGLNGTELRFYANMLLLKELLHFLNKISLEYKTLLQLVPDKNYGIFLASEIGDLGIVFKVKEGKVTISFPRQEIDSISRSWYLPKRLSEFQKICRLHIAIGARLEKFLHDLTSGSFFKEFRAAFGKEYLISDGSQHYALIARAMKKSSVNIYLFLDKENKAAFGFSLKNKKIYMLSAAYLDMVNQMIEEIQDYGEIIQLLSKASSGKEQIAFFRIQIVKKLLSGVIAPSRIRKLVFKLMERAVGL